MKTTPIPKSPGEALRVDPDLLARARAAVENTPQKGRWFATPFQYIHPDASDEVFFAVCFLYGESFRVNKNERKRKHCTECDSPILTGDVYFGRTLVDPYESRKPSRSNFAPFCSCECLSDRLEKVKSKLGVD